MLQHFGRTAHTVANTEEEESEFVRRAIQESLKYGGNQIVRF